MQVLPPLFSVAFRITAEESVLNSSELEDNKKQIAAWMRTKEVGSRFPRTLISNYLHMCTHAYMYVLFLCLGGKWREVSHRSGGSYDGQDSGVQLLHERYQECAAQGASLDHQRVQRYSPRTEGCHNLLTAS